MTQANRNYTLACIEGVDQGMCPTSCRDRFQVKLNGVPHFEVTFDYALLNSDGDIVEGANPGDCNARVKVLDPDEVTNFPPSVSNGFELIGRVMDRLNELLSEAEGEFYADCFWDEDGNKVERVITF